MLARIVCAQSYKSMNIRVGHYNHYTIMNFFVNKMQAVVKKPHFLKKAGKHIYKNKNIHKFCIKMAHELINAVKRGFYENFIQPKTRQKNRKNFVCCQKNNFLKPVKVKQILRYKK